MAGVKAKKDGAGKSVEPRWTPTECSTCSKVIEKGEKAGFPAKRVKIITFTGAKGSTRYEWRHTGCVK